MQIDTAHQSVNYSSRDGHAVSMIVLHATVGSYNSALAWLTNPSSRVSTHYLISKMGHVARLVDDANAAWHAGKAAWQGLNAAAIQKCSIGIELENANSGHDPYPPAQINALLELSHILVDRYHIHPDLVTRHLDIATPRGRKSDPASFPWPHYLGELFPAAPVVGHYRVKAGAGANVRNAPRTNASVVTVIIDGAPFDGVKVPGQNVTVKPFGTSDVWVKGERGYVWSLLLEAK